MLQPWMIPSDLSPGDGKALERDWSGLELHTVQAAEDLYFTIAYEALWQQFGAAHEVEEAQVLQQRLGWDGRALIDGHAFLYALQVLTSDGKFAGVLDHTAILPPSRSEVIVHISHVLAAPEWRRTGLAAWIRALPLADARRCLAVQGCAPNLPITLVGEMDPFNGNDPAHVSRFSAYERAGYLLVDPRVVAYFQPDFRPPELIDQNGGPQPIPMYLVVRRLGREDERSISRVEVSEMVKALYRMYAASLRAEDIAPLLGWLDCDLGEQDRIGLMTPTEFLRIGG